MAKNNITKDFSVDLEHWFKLNHNKTVGDLLEFFGEKSFAILFLVFMFIPSLPVPTGGITTIVLIPGTIITSIEMMFGRRSLWLPSRITKIKINSSVLKKAIPFMIRRVRWLEKFSRPRLSSLFDKASFRTMTGIIVFIFAIATQIAPPFSGLDTLPALGIVLIALATILEDFAIFIVGIMVGAAGIGVLLTAASAIILFFQKVFL